MKFIYLTDTQIRGLTPSGRTGSFPDDMYAKFEEIIAIGRAHEVGYYVHGGDFFDLPNISLSICDRFADLMESTGASWYIVRGNHDEIGNNPELSGGSVLDHLFRRSTLIKHLVSDRDGPVCGFDYFHGIEAWIKEHGLMLVREGGIAVPHAFILPDDTTLPFEHVKYSELKTNAKMVLLSHYHDDNGIYTRKDGVVFVSVGALARMTLADLDVNRVPKIALIDTNSYKVQVITLTTVRSKEETFRLELKANQAAHASLLDDFVRSLESAKLQGLNLRQVIESAAESDARFDRTVVESVMERIGRFEGVGE